MPRDGRDVGVVTTLAGLTIILAVLAIGVWAIRHQNRTFSKGFGRTGWNPQRDHASWFRTKFTWLSGGAARESGYAAAGSARR